MPWPGWGGGAANAVFWCSEIGELRPTGLLAKSLTLVWLDQATGYVVRISVLRPWKHLGVNPPPESHRGSGNHVSAVKLFGETGSGPAQPSPRIASGLPQNLAERLLDGPKINADLDQPVQLTPLAVIGRRDAVDPSGLRSVYNATLAAFLEIRKAKVLSPLWLKTPQSCGYDARHSASPLC